MRRVLLLPIFMLLFAAAAFAESNGLPQVVTDIKQAFVKGSLVVKGEGAAPADKGLSAAQKRILALRAAKVIALREVSEILDGVTVNGETMVVNAAAESDAVRATVQGIVKGAQVIKEVYDPLSEMGVVYITVPMTGPNGVLATLLPQVIPLMPPSMETAYQPPAELAQAKNYDGLILDVRALPFKPALINRVVTKNNEVIYDPSKVDRGILAERGAAEYTNDMGKAKALLGERGSANPLVVQAAGLVKSTDVEVAPDEAGAIFASNQANNFLANARVVFVLQ